MFQSPSQKIEPTEVFVHCIIPGSFGLFLWFCCCGGDGGFLLLFFGFLGCLFVFLKEKLVSSSCNSKGNILNQR